MTVQEYTRYSRVKSKESVSLVLRFMPSFTFNTDYMARELFVMSHGSYNRHFFSILIHQFVPKNS